MSRQGILNSNKLAVLVSFFCFLIFVFVQQTDIESNNVEGKKAQKFSHVVNGM